MPLDVPKALVELQTKSLAQIESETAYTWASRALAAWQLYQQTGDTRRFMAYVTMRDEAIEHAAFASPEVLEELRRVL
jgi:hypothetical protein